MTSERPDLHGTRIEQIHAVTDGPGGLLTAVAPHDRDKARALRARHAGQFWCSTAAGGCGAPLQLKAGEILVPHFAHLARTSHCPIASGRRTSADSYAHLAYQLALQEWLADQGHTATIEHTFPAEGGRADLHIDLEGTSHSIEVQLSPLTEESWDTRTTKYLQHARVVTWLFGEPRETEAVRALRSPALVSMRIGEEDGVVVLGATSLLETHWDLLTDCTYSPAGIWTPGLAEALAQSTQARAEDERAREDAERRAREAAAAKERARRAALERPREGPWRSAGRGASHGRKTVAERLAGLPLFEQWRQQHGAAVADGLPAELVVLAQLTAYGACVLSTGGTTDVLSLADTDPGDEATVWEHLASAGYVQLQPLGQHGVRWDRVEADEPPLAVQGLQEP